MSLSAISSQKPRTGNTSREYFFDLEEEDNEVAAKRQRKEADETEEVGFESALEEQLEEKFMENQAHSHNSNIEEPVERALESLIAPPTRPIIEEDIDNRTDTPEITEEDCNKKEDLEDDYEVIFTGIKPIPPKMDMNDLRQLLHGDRYRHILDLSSFDTIRQHRRDKERLERTYQRTQRNLDSLN